MSKPDMGSIIHIKNQWNILAIRNYYVNYQNYQNLMLLTSSDTKRTLLHLLLFTNSAQRELVSICTQVYTTAICFPCLTFLTYTIFHFSRTLPLTDDTGRGGNNGINARRELFHFNVKTMTSWGPSERGKCVSKI